MAEALRLPGHSKGPLVPPPPRVHFRRLWTFPWILHFHIRLVVGIEASCVPPSLSVGGLYDPLSPQLLVLFFDRPQVFLEGFQFLPKDIYLCPHLLEHP